MAKKATIKRGLRSEPELPNPARRALRQLGQHIHEARLRRRITGALLAQRASISRTTLQKIERGEAGVAMGNYAAVLFSLGLVDALAAIADLKNDQVGQMLDEERLPKRVRLSRGVPKKPRSVEGR